MADLPRIHTQYLIQLTDEELYALGMVSAQWAALEMLLDTNTVWCSERHKKLLPKSYYQDGFRNKRTAFVDLARLAKLPIDQLAAIEAANTDMANLVDERHKLTHGAAYRYHPNRGVQFISATGRPKRNFRHRTTLKRMCMLAENVSSLNSRLVRFFDYWAR